MGIGQKQAGPAVPKPDLARTQRLMIYSGELTLVVESVAEAIETVKKTAEQAGGFMQSMEAAAIVVKVPAAKFLDLVASVEKLGEVTRKEIKGEDVTDKMRDLTIRLKNAEEFRKRLVALLERANKVEEAIKIEKELERITEAIELFKGKMRALEEQIAYSTLTVRLNSPLPARMVKQGVPFPWVRELAGDLTRGEVSRLRVAAFASRVTFQLPKAFAKYYQVDYLTRATSPDGVLIKVQRHHNVKGADLEFWTELAKRSIAAKRAILVKATRDASLKWHVQAKVIEGVKEVGGKQYRYVLALAVVTRLFGSGHVFTYEAWGPADEFGPREQAIDQSMRSMNLLPCYKKPFRLFR